MKTIFITGATENTGLAIARHFASNGYDVALSSRSKERACKTALDLSNEFQINSKGYALNLTDINDITEVFGKVKEDFGQIDVFVANSANLGIGVGVMNTSPDDFDSIMYVNARGTFFCCQKAASAMIEQGYGNIVIIGSIQSKGAVRGRTVYSMSKSAVSSLTKCLAYELGEYNIRVNSVVAGAIHSSRWDNLTEDELNLRRNRYPLGREASEQDIANAVFYLGTELSSSTTGIDLIVDSGLSTCLLPYSKACTN